MKRLASYKVLIAFSLIVLIIIGGVFLFQQQPWSKEPMEITLTTPASTLPAEMEVYVGGAVVSPGWYPFEPGDGIEDVLSMAGGVTSDADSARVKLYICEKFDDGESVAPQLVSINCIQLSGALASPWILVVDLGYSLNRRLIEDTSITSTF